MTRSNISSRKRERDSVALGCEDVSHNIDSPYSCF